MGERALCPVCQTYNALGPLVRLYNGRTGTVLRVPNVQGTGALVRLYEGKMGTLLSVPNIQCTGDTS